MKISNKDVCEALNKLETNGYKAYLVGGAVRNMFLGEDIFDYDITTNAKPKEIKLLFSKHKQYTVGEKHGTVCVFLGKTKIDITTFRKEEKYEDNRHPSKVHFTDDLEDDLTRRDFTINSICIDKNNQVIDKFDGQKDIQNKTIKAIGDPKTRFEEDSLRILRALRFQCRYNFKIDRKTEKAMFECAPLLKNISKERCKSELLEIFKGKTKQYTINKYLPILNNLLPFTRVDKKIDKLTDPYFVLAYALSKTEGYNLKSLKFSKKEIDYINDLLKATKIKIDNQYQVIKSLSTPNKKNVLKYLNELHDKKAEEIYKNNTHAAIELKDLKITGYELIQLGFTGPDIKKVQNKLLDVIFKNKLKNNKKDITEYLKKNKKTILK